MKAPYIPFIENISLPAVNRVDDIDSTVSGDLPLKSIALYAGTDQKLQAIWYVKAPDHFKQKLRTKYSQSYLQNYYKFHGTKVLNLHIKGQEIFAAQLHHLLLLSPSSRAVEQSIRAYRGGRQRANLDNVKITPGAVIMNTPSLDNWVSRLGLVKYQPSVKNAFKGTSPALLTLHQKGDKQHRRYSFSGTISLEKKQKSPLISALSYKNKPLTLDQYISSDADGYALFRSPPPGLPKKLPDTTKVDTFLVHHDDYYAKASKTLDDEFGIEMFAHSGFNSKSEYLFLRRLKDPLKLHNLLEIMSQRGLINRRGQTYFVQSHGLARLLGSQLCNFRSFYVTITGDVVILSKYKGLISRVASDHKQRRVITYQPYFKKMLPAFPKKPSGLFVGGPEFASFLSPLVATPPYISAITSPFKYIALTTQLNTTGDSLAVNIATFNGERSKRPYRENWTHNTRDAELSGPPILANLGGNSNKEIVFATTDGQVYVLAADGTVVQKYDTGSDTPIGSPVAYDWYGTGHNVILIAAGDKIYGWDTHGDALPEFPFKLDKPITTPLTVADINHDRTPDAIAGTADRKLHVINRRGDNLPGWPVETNSPIHTAPWTGYYQGQSAVVLFTGNTVHAWNTSGNILPGFPVFMGAALRGQPVKFKKAILGNAADGRLYAIGNTVPFSDSRNVYKGSGSSGPKVKAVNISSHALSGSPFVYRNSILTTNSNGTLFLLNASGKLQHTESMGQPSAPQWTSHIVDINSNGNDDFIALSKSGRLYGWRMSDGKQLTDLPKAGMKYVTIGDIEGNGLKEIVAQTNKGIQCWTISQKP